MATQSDGKAKSAREPDAAITRIAVSGFKSIREEQSIEIRPLTVLAGANSSGKSSIVQAVLLLKQTLEATYDPGPILLNGPNVRFTDAAQLLSRTRKGEPVEGFEVGIDFGPESAVRIAFARDKKTGLDISRCTITADGKPLSLSIGMGKKTLHRQVAEAMSRELGETPQDFGTKRHWSIERTRCFLRLRVEIRNASFGRLQGTVTWPKPLLQAEDCLRHVIHVPALRGNPQRTYPVTAVGSTFAGTFESYVASVIAKWQADRDPRVKGVRDDLSLLNLSWKVVARAVSDAEVELQVGRLPHAARGGAGDLVSVADVGFGVSQALPVVVALHVATPRHLVYLEQPEIHLHPRAQVGMARVLAAAARRGVRMVVETHSSLLLLALQTLVAEGSLSPNLVGLHWFARSGRDGATRITSADLDKAGAFGDWPEDFGDVEMEAERRYLDAAEAKMGAK